MKLLLPLVAFAALLVLLDWQQHWRAEGLLKGRGELSACRPELPCALRAVEADMSSILSKNRSFLGRSFFPEIQFQPDRKCGRGGRYDVQYWARE